MYIFVQHWICWILNYIRIRLYAHLRRFWNSNKSNNCNNFRRHHTSLTFPFVKTRFHFTLYLFTKTCKWIVHPITSTINLFFQILKELGWWREKEKKKLTSVKEKTNKSKSCYQINRISIRIIIIRFEKKMLCFNLCVVGICQNFDLICTQNVTILWVTNVFSVCHENLGKMLFIFIHKYWNFRWFVRK